MEKLYKAVYLTTDAECFIADGREQTVSVFLALKMSKHCYMHQASRGQHRNC